MMLTRTNLLTATRRLDERMASEPLTTAVAGPYPEGREEADRFKSWGGTAPELYSREKMGFINEKFRSALGHLKSETPEAMVAEANASKAGKIADRAHTTACWALGVTMLVAVPVALLGGLDMVAGAINVLAWPAQAVGPGLSGAGALFTGLGVGLGTFAAAAGISELADKRAEEMKSVPERLQQWQLFGA